MKTKLLLIVISFFVALATMSQTIIEEEQDNSFIMFEYRDEEPKMMFIVRTNPDGTVNTENIKYSITSDFIIYPNPVNQYLYISSSQNNDKYSYLEIVDINNKCIYKSEFNRIKEIDVSTFSKGLYVIKIFEKNKFETHKIVIE